jgi:hypothetical protein
MGNGTPMEKITYKHVVSNLQWEESHAFAELFERWPENIEQSYVILVNKAFNLITVMGRKQRSKPKRYSNNATLCFCVIV